MRHRTTLIEGWQFAPDLGAPAVIKANELKPPVDGWRPVRVPGYWQSQFRDLARSTGVGWYRIELDLDEPWLEHDSLTIEFGAVSHFCQGWLNGSYLGHHEGGHLPFSWSLSVAARPGTNELLVRVVSPSGDRTRFREFPFEETLHGKQSWYGPNGGIWQDVALEARSSYAVAELSVRPMADDGSIELRADLGSDAPTDPAAPEIRFGIVDPDGTEIADASSSTGESITIQLGEHQLQRWSPETPSLYRVHATVLVDGRDVDRIEQRFGFRTFVADRGRFLLNGEPIVIRGVLDQDYWDGPGVPTAKQDIVERFTLRESHGLQHAEVPHQGARPAVPRGRRRARPARVVRAADHAHVSPVPHVAGSRRRCPR